MEPQWDDDPEFPDEQDDNFQQEQFELFKMRGWSPEDLRDELLAKKYAAWLLDNR